MNLARATVSDIFRALGDAERGDGATAGAHSAKRIAIQSFLADLARVPARTITGEGKVKAIELYRP